MTILKNDTTGGAFLTQFPKDKLIFIPLGGVGEFGRNMYVYAYNGKYLIVDLGVGFTKDYPGVDFTLPDPSFVEKHQKDIVGLFISHGHFDHVGAIYHLWTRLRCPIYASPFCIAMIEDRLDETGMLGRVPLIKVEKGEMIDLDPFKITGIHINHSIPETLLLHIQTKTANAVHCTDWKFDENPLIEKKTDINVLKKIGDAGVTALLCDSTNIGVEGFSPSESKAADNLRTLFKTLKGSRIIVTLFSTHVARMRTIANIAQEMGRKVALVGRSLWSVDNAARETGYFFGLPEFLTDEEAADLPDDKIIYISTGSQAQARSALVRASYSSHRLLKIKKGDAIIFSARQIPGHEQAIKNMQLRLANLGATILTNEDVTEDTLVHASGHANKEDIRKMYQLIRPKMAIPIHGELPEIKMQVDLAESCGVPYICEVIDGDVIQIDNKEPAIIGQVPIGVLALDGSRVIELKSDVLAKRKKMIVDGSMIITLAVTADQEILGSIQIAAPGLFDGSSKELAKLKDILAEEITDMDDDQFFDDAQLKSAIVKTAKKYAKDLTEKKPVTEVHLIRV